MHSREAVQWIEEKGITEKAKPEIFKKVLADCLNVTDEHVLILGDTGSKNNRVAAIVSASYYLAAKELGKEVKLVLQEPKFKGDKADEDVIDSLYKIAI